FPGDSQVGQPAISSHNEAAVDSELTTLGLFSRTISGVLNNPYYRSFLPITEANLPAMLLVCRLDAPSPEIVQRMMEDSLAAEKKGLRGFTYVDARGISDGGYAEGDKWLLKIASDARKAGSPVILDNGPGLFPGSYPMRNAAFYFGWYTENVEGPMARPDFRFPPGAVAVHIHSFSASTLRDPKRAWCAPLLAAGATATMGNVFEPYLSLTPNLDIFHERLRAGFTFAESAWMSERVLSWMTTFVGDPLYRPFPPISASTPPASEWEAYAAGAKLWAQNPEIGRTTLTASAQKMKSGMILEGLGLLQLAGAHPEEAAETFAQARRLYTRPEDILRASIHEILQLRGLKKEAAALVLIRKQLKLYPASPAADLLRMFEKELAPPPPPVVPGPPSS
ncbi:MAG: TIGR03790 family protein, partial [Verrucomicrobiota bacterium]